MSLIKKLVRTLPLTLSVLISSCTNHLNYLPPESLPLKDTNLTQIFPVDFYKSNTSHLAIISVPITNSITRKSDSHTLAIVPTYQTITNRKTGELEYFILTNTPIKMAKRGTYIPNPSKEFSQIEYFTSRYVKNHTLFFYENP
ncbi:MAG: hypothetical protein AABX66_00450 [Nanoarchaeota archaeon]